MDFENFQFIEPGILEDKDLVLRLAKTVPGVREKQWLPTYHFDLCESGNKTKIGNVELRVGYTDDIKMYGGNLAYGVQPQQQGKKYAERACRLLFPLARFHGMHELWITCNPDNWPSRRTCERLGATLVGIVPLPEHNDMYLRGEREKCRYVVAIRR